MADSTNTDGEAAVKTSKLDNNVPTESGMESYPTSITAAANEFLEDCGKTVHGQTTIPRV